MKKVYGSNIFPKTSDFDDTSDNEETNIRDVKQKKFNAFSLLNNTSDDEKQDNTDENDVVSQEEGENTQKEEIKRKKKKRQRKNRNQTPQNAGAIKNDSEDEIERTVREVNKLLGEPTPSTSQVDVESSKSIVLKSKDEILSVHHKHLNPINELKRIFGSKTVQAEENKQRSKRRTGHLKKTWLVSPRDSWLPFAKTGLSMTFDTSMESQDGTQYFVYEHGPSYRQAQMKFIQAVESSDHENIISMVNQHPYHVDALIQLSELCKLSEDLATAAQLIERALYTLEYAFHPLFNLTTANYRLDYRKQQNRSFYVVLFKHLTFVSGRACYRTSLELSKFLLSLDPVDDPLAAVLMIDFYALRAREYEWFVKFCKLWECSRNLSQLPNIAYSLALAHFRLKEQETANELLQNALLMFPGVLMPLLDKCSVQTDSRVQGHDYFNSKAASTTPPSLEKLQDLFVNRTYHVWKEAEVLPWLEKQVNIVLDRVDSKDEAVKFYQCKRSKRYQGKLPRNILRHIILSDLKGVTIAVSETQQVPSNGPILSYDPLPPLETIDIYPNPRASRRINEASNVLSLFFTSLFRDVGGNPADFNGFLVGDNPEEND